MIHKGYPRNRYDNTYMQKFTLPLIFFILTRLRVSRNGFIVIRPVMESDAGTYVCNAQNVAGTTSIPVVLQVHG